MKIKCPFCGEESDIKESDPLAWHFVKDHKYSKDGMAGEYAELIFKIHEKMEALNDGRLLLEQPLELTKEILKSLLEDEK